jgi:murein L,D-transpeptidase YcbB/YkuD
MNQCIWFSPILLASSLLWTSPALANAVNDERVRDRAEIGNVARVAASVRVDKELWTLIRTGLLAEMRWPNFADQRRAVKDFYKPADYQLAWINEIQRPTEQAMALIAALESADQLGLRPEDYDGPRWAARLAHLQSSSSPSPAELARLDLALTVSVMRYVSDQYRGRLDPEDFQFHWPRKECNTAEILRNRLVKAKSITAVLEQLQPPYAGYRHTLKVLNDYMAIAKEPQGDLPMPAKPVWSGDIYPGVQELARRLKRLGDMPAYVKVPVGSELYEDDLKSAVRHFQRRNGLNPDGSLEPNTYKQLTIPLEDRIAQLQLTLEFWRWLPADLKTPWILINIPEFKLRAFSDGRPTLSMDIVVGEAAQHETPMFVDRVDYLIFRPDWRVPLKIQQKEIVPQIESNPTYLARKGFQVFDGEGAVKTTAVDGPTLQKLRAGKLELRQEPGSANELGLVKFVLPGQDGVYMHGTLDRDLFSRLRRDFSHGCIRLEDPAALSLWALEGDSQWDAKAIDKAMNGNLTMKVNLPRPITVITFYGTAMVDDNGEVHFSQDIYGYDAALEKALAKARPYSREP